MSKVSESFEENWKNADEDAAKEEIFNQLQKIRDCKALKKKDDKLKQAKQIVSDLNKGYSAVENDCKTKIDYLRAVIEKIKANDVNPTSGLREE